MPSGTRKIATLCHTSDCCPELHEDPSAAAEQRYIITDDFGGSIRLSHDQVLELFRNDGAQLLAQ